MTKFMFLISLLFLGILLSAGDKLDGKNPSGRPGRRTPPRPTQPPPSLPPRKTQPPPSPPPRPTQSPPPPPPPRPTQPPPSPPTQPPLLVTPPRPTPSPSRPTQPPPSPPPQPTQSPPPPPPQPTQPPPLVTPPSPTPSPPSPSHPPNLPYYVLSLTWPNTFCGQHTCNPWHPRERFTIHGLWPQQKINIPRKSVRPDMDFDDTVITFKEDLVRYWPNLINSIHPESGVDFWRREWLAHGQYSNMFASTYFSLTMCLMDIYNPLPMLEREGVRANGGSYQKAHILFALQNGLENHVADISCVPDRAGHYQLSEVRICFGENIILMNCTAGSLAKSCRDRDVIFP